MIIGEGCIRTVVLTIERTITFSMVTTTFGSIEEIYIVNPDVRCSLDFHIVIAGTLILNGHITYLHVAPIDKTHTESIEDGIIANTFYGNSHLSRSVIALQ